MEHQSSSHRSICSVNLSDYIQKPPKEWKLCAVLLFFALFTTTISAQQVQVTGKVEARDVGGPLPGVTVLEKGVSNGTSTDFDGNYSLTVSDPQAVLVFSYGNYSSTQEDLWMNPEMNNFNFKDTGFSGKYTPGDPRWRAKL